MRNNYEVQLEKLYYEYYVTVLSYLYCPRYMQSVSMIERCKKILEELVYLQSVEYKYMNNPFNALFCSIKLFESCLFLARDFVESYYKVTLPAFTEDFISDFIGNLSCKNILTYLKHNARNSQVERYFNL